MSDTSVDAVEAGLRPTPGPLAMTPPPAPKQFTTAVGRGAQPVEFAIDGEAFFAAAEMPLGSMVDVARTALNGEPAEKIIAIMDFLDQILMPDSAVRFAGRMRSAERPIGMDEAGEIVKWLVQEVYAARPTVRPSS